MSAHDPKRTLFALTAEAEAKRPAGCPLQRRGFLHSGEERVGFRWPSFFVGGGSRVTGTLPRIC